LGEAKKPKKKEAQVVRVGRESMEVIGWVSKFWQMDQRKKEGGTLGGWMMFGSAEICEKNKK
jgi:hypothetical protein